MIAKVWGAYGPRDRLAGIARRAAPTLLGTGCILALALGGAGATGDELQAVKRFSEATVGFDLKGSYKNVTLTVTGPNGFHVTAHSERTAPVINLRKFGKVEDGRYKYQLSAATNKRIERRTTLDNGRGEAENRGEFAGVTTTGAFLIKDGAIFEPEELEERYAPVLAPLSGPGSSSGDDPNPPAR